MRTPHHFSDSAPRRSGSRGCVPQWPGQLRSLADVVSHYRAGGARSAEDELRYYADQPTLRDAVHAAGLARSAGGRRHPHQHRLPEALLRECASLLEAELPAIRRARSFEELHGVVKAAIGDLRGVGELMVYDTALRIGAKLGVEPRRVFLHAGVRDGARNLGLNATAESLAMAELPAGLRSLRALEAEDVLCIYKDDFRRIGPGAV